MTKFAVTMFLRRDRLTQTTIEVDAHSQRDAVYLANLIYGGQWIIADIGAWKERKPRPLTFAVRLKTLFGGAV